MLTRQFIFSRVADEEVEIIWEPVRVDYDNALQLPISFRHRGKDHEVIEIIGHFRDSVDDPSITWLVRTPGGVFSLYLTSEGEGGPAYVRPARWILHSRIEEKRSDTMLVDMKLKRVADFHGHLCPDLAIGYRACQFAFRTLRLERMWQPRMRVIMENRTSALDAVQMLTGCTTGNARLQIVDRGNHAYTFIPEGESGLRLEARSSIMSGGDGFGGLERRIEAGAATLDEVTRYWAWVEQRVGFLLNLADDDIFESQRVSLYPTNRRGGS